MAQASLMNRIAFNVKIQNMHRLKQVFSNVFDINGMQWKFEVEKIAACYKENRFEDTVGVWLQCIILGNRKDYMCGAQAKIKLVSYKDDENSLQECVCGVYDSENTTWGLKSFIAWKDLFVNGYIQDDTAIFEMELKVGPMEYKGCNSLIMKTIKDKYEGEEVSEKTMKLILNRIDEDFVATKTTKFKFNELLWHVVVTKWFDINRDYFRVELHCDNEQSSNDNNWSCELSVTIKLVAANADDDNSVEECDSFKFNKNENYFSMNVVEWSELEKGFVKQSTMEMMLKFKVKNMPIVVIEDE